MIKERPAELREYSDWEEACRYSREARAVGRINIDLHGKLIRAEIVKPRFGDATIQYWHSGLRIRKATPGEVDTCRKWKPY